MCNDLREIQEKRTISVKIAAPLVLAVCLLVSLEGLLAAVAIHQHLRDAITQHACHISAVDWLLILLRKLLKSWKCESSYFFLSIFLLISM